MFRNLIVPSTADNSRACFEVTKKAPNVADICMGLTSNNFRRINANILNFLSNCYAEKRKDLAYNDKLQTRSFLPDACEHLQ